MKLIPLDRVATSDNHENVTRRLNALIDENRHCNRDEDEMFAIFRRERLTSLNDQNGWITPMTSSLALSWNTRSKM